MIDQRINSCLTFYQRKCPHLTITERYFLFPQILNAIDIVLAEGICLDCKKYIDRLALSTKSALRGETPNQIITSMVSESERRQQVGIAVRYLTRMVTSRSVIWKEK